MNTWNNDELLRECAAILFDSQALPPVIAPCDHYAGNAKYLSKAFELQRSNSKLIDVTCDLEDGAAISSKDSWFEQALELILSDSKCGARCGIRVHPPQEESSFASEVSRVASQIGGLISHITIPKIDSLPLFERTIDFIQEQFKSHGHPTPYIHILIESPAILPFLDQIAANPAVRTLEFGIMDFISSLNGGLSIDLCNSPSQFTNPLLSRVKTEIVLSAYRHNKVAVHNVTVNYKEKDQTYRDALTAKREFGFRRMWSIHPDQVTQIISAFTPTNQEAEDLNLILSAAKQADWGPISFKGKLHDRASYRSIFCQLRTLNPNL